MLRAATEFERMLDRQDEYFKKVKFKCSHCGRKMIFKYYENKVICDHCGQAIYRNKKAEFEDKLRRELRRCT